MPSRAQRFLSPALMAGMTLALLSGLSAAHASSPDAWEEFQDAVRAKCTAAASGTMTVSHVQVDPFGSEKYGIAILTGKEQGADQVSRTVCIFNKQTEEAEIGSMLPLDPGKTVVAATTAPDPAPHCEIFTQAGFQGTQGLIIANDMLRFQPETDAAKNVSGTGAQRVFFDASWLNNIRSVKTSPSCTLIAWDQTDLQSPQRFYRGENAALDAASQGKIGAALCQCQP